MVNDAPATSRLLALNPWLLAAIGTGLFLLAFPPFGLWPLAGIGPVFLTASMMTATSAKRAYGRGFVVGLVVFGLGNLWVAASSPVNLVGVALVQAVWFGVFGVLARAGCGGRPAWPTLPLVWGAVEFARHHLPMSGYPWNLAGMAWAADERAVQIADLGGVHLVSFVAVSLGAGLWSWFDRQRGLGLAGLLLVVSALVYGLIRPGMLEPSAPGPLVGTIQPNFVQELKEDGLTWDVRLRMCYEATAELLAEHPDLDLLLWPETIFPPPVGRGDPGDRWFPDSDYGPAEAAQVEEALAASLRNLGGVTPPWSLVGALHIEGDLEKEMIRKNVGLFFDPSGRRVDLYAKHILVPGGEYIPYANDLPDGLRSLVSDAIESLAGFLATLTPGEGPAVLDWDRGPLFSVTICYENAYGDYFRDGVRLGAQFHVNLSNEAWFRESTEFDHMELHSILRAVESRRALFRSTNSGISCLVHPDGHVEKLTVDGRDRAVGGTFARRVPVRDDETPYVRFGDVVAWMCVIGALVLPFTRRRLGSVP